MESCSRMFCHEVEENLDRFLLYTDPWKYQEEIDRNMICASVVAIRDTLVDIKPWCQYCNFFKGNNCITGSLNDICFCKYFLMECLHKDIPMPYSCFLHPLI